MTCSFHRFSTCQIIPSVHEIKVSIQISCKEGYGGGQSVKCRLLCINEGKAMGGAECEVQGYCVNEGEAWGWVDAR